MPLPNEFLRGRGRADFSGQQDGGFAARKPVAPAANPESLAQGGVTPVPRAPVSPMTRPAQLPHKQATPVPKAPIPNPIMSRKERVARNAARNSARAEALRKKNAPVNQLAGPQAPGAGNLLDQAGQNVNPAQPAPIGQFPGSAWDTADQFGNSQPGNQPPPWAQLAGGMPQNGTYLPQPQGQSQMTPEQLQQLRQQQLQQAQMQGQGNIF